MNIILVADDYGFSIERDRAISLAYKNGLCTQIGFAVNFQRFEGSLNFAIMNGFVNLLTFHMNIADGPPVSSSILKSPEFVIDGQFCRPSIRGRRFEDDQLNNVLEIRHEVRKQIERFVGAGLSFMHFDSHEYTHMEPSVWEACETLLDEFGFKSMRGLRQEVLPYNDKRWGIAAKLLDRYRKNNRILVPWSGPVQTYLKHRKEVNELYEIIEIYTHPKIIDGMLMDGDTGETLENQINKISGNKFINYSQLY